MTEASNLSIRLDEKIAGAPPKSGGYLIALTLVKELTSTPYVPMKKLQEQKKSLIIIAWAAELFVTNFAQEGFLEFASKCERYVLPFVSMFLDVHTDRLQVHSHKG